MSAGRCAGCGKVSASCKLIGAHVLECPGFRELFLRDPAAALDPEAEYARWQAEDLSGERAERRQQAEDDNKSRRAAMASRYATPKDILED